MWRGPGPSRILRARRRRRTESNTPMNKLSTTFAVALCTAACASSPAQTQSAASVHNPPPVAVDAAVSSLTNEPVAAAAAPAADAPAPEPVRIVAGDRRAVPTPGPHVAITAPANGATVREDRVEVRLAVQHWRNTTDANDHRHIHLVLDNEEYRRVDDPAQPVVLEHLAQGTHVLRAFAGWETHETVKQDGAFAVAVFHVGAPTAHFGFDAHAPLLTYSRPKGTVSGADASRVLLDFYLTNIPADRLGAQGFRVRPTVDGSTLDDLTAWVPYYVEHLADGPHTITLQLVDAAGAPAPGPFNHIERRITVTHAAPADPHAHPAH